MTKIFFAIQGAFFTGIGVASMFIGRSDITFNALIVGALSALVLEAIQIAENTKVKQ